MTLNGAIEKLQRRMILRALKRRLGNVTQAAADLGVQRTHLYWLMEKVGIKLDDLGYERLKLRGGVPKGTINGPRRARLMLELHAAIEALAFRRERGLS